MPAGATQQGLALRLLCLDPSFRATGWSVMDVYILDETLVAAGVVRTQKSDKKQRLYVSDDDHRCAQEIAAALASLIRRWRPDVVCTEAKQGSKSARSAALIGAVAAVVSAVTALLSVAVVQVQPQQVKKLVCGANNASKDEVKAAVKRRYGEDAVDSFLLPYPSGVYEHVYDSVAVGWACLPSPTVQAMRSRHV